MEGIATIFEGENQERIWSVWLELQSKCAIPEIPASVLPHITWHLAESYHSAELSRALENICMKRQPFVIRTAGLGIFSGERPVVFINIIKDEFLMEVHQQLWEIFTPYANGVNPYYSPENWVPHITIFHDELFDPLPERLEIQNRWTCILNVLSRQPLEWQLQANNLSYGRMIDGQIHFQYYPLDGSGKT